MKNLLIVNYRAPYPVISGDKIRAFQHIKILSQKFRITLVYINDNNRDADTTELGKYVDEVVTFRFNKYVSLFITIMRLIIFAEPMQVSYYRNRKMKRWINRNLDRFDFALCNHLRTAQFICNTKIFKIIDLVDSVELNTRNAYETSYGLRKLIYYLENKLVSKYERIVVEHFDKSIFISNKDKDNFMNGYTGSKTPEVIPNYSRDLGYDMNRDVKIKSLKISFIGKMSYEPNVNAVKHFVNNVFLEIKKTYPDLEFHIIGPNPSKYIKSLENVTGIKVRGFVDDPAYELMSSKLIVAPMRSGSGMQNKILESMYLGKVVVTNHLGISGFDNISDNEIVICESDLDMISKINSLLNDKNSNMISEIGSNARKYVISNYSFDFVQQKYLSLF